MIVNVLYRYSSSRAQFLRHNFHKFVEVNRPRVVLVNLKQNNMLQIHITVKEKESVSQN